MKNRNPILTTIILALSCFALAQKAQAVSPPPDGGYANFTTAEGQNALKSLTTGSANTAVGWFSLFSNTDGSFNTAVGTGALLFNVGDQSAGEGIENTAVGATALLFNSTGSSNTASGTSALQSNTTGSNNVATGFQALNSNATGDYNTANGFQALFSNTTGTANVATGPGTLFHNVDGGGNTGTGANFVLFNNTHGGGNTATGDFTLANNIDGNFNTADGWAALSNNTSGGSNTAIGWNAGQGVSTASNVICVGANVLGADVSDSCYIGNIHGATIDPATAAAVGVDSTGKLGTVASSRRFKHDIKPMDDASEAILALRPVTFHYKSDTKNTPCFGLVAEDVAQVNPDLVLRNKDGEILSVRYDQVNAMLLNEFLKEHKAFIEEQRKVEQQDRKLQEQEATIGQLTKQVETVVARLREHDSEIQRVNNQLQVNSSVTHVIADNH